MPSAELGSTPLTYPSRAVGGLAMVEPDPATSPDERLRTAQNLVRERRRTEWCDANKPGHQIDSFLEGPSFDCEGNLYVTDIPFGRIFRISPQLEWSLVAEYDGWPNGLAIHRDGSLWISDYRRGLLKLERDAIVLYDRLAEVEKDERRAAAFRR
mgnify:CR=1 FL=1